MDSMDTIHKTLDPATMPAPAGADEAQEGRGRIRFGLLGHTLGHSWSPQIHERLGSWPYQLVELEPDELGSYVREGRWEGLNVTIPYKRDVMAFVDDLTPEAQRLGAVNTLVRRGDRIVGDNTDLFGFSWLLRRFCEANLGGIDRLRDEEVLVLGSGGASRAVLGALEDSGARAHVISRHGEDTYETLFERHAGARLVVNATPVGMYPNCPASPLAAETLATLPRLGGVLDVVYNPERTGIVLAAESLDIPAEGGLAMLVAQAWRSSELWQGHALDEGLITTIEQELRSGERNVVLIGMPGSGKTSCGRERFGRSAADVIEHDGEDAFRNMETEVLADYAKRSSQVLSCGGGVVTRPENLGLMRQNGVVIMLDRPLEHLSSRGRPISRSRGVEALAAERMPLYHAWADHIVRCTGSAHGDAIEVARLLGL